MKTFKDKSGMAWEIAINTNTLKRVRDLAKFDLMKVVESREVIESLGDPFTLVNVLYAACKPQAEAAKVADEAFAELLDGDSLEAATTILLEELADFFPMHRRRPLRLALEKMQNLREKTATMAMEKINSPETERQILDAVQAALDKPLQMDGLSSGNVPG